MSGTSFAAIGMLAAVLSTRFVGAQESVGHSAASPQRASLSSLGERCSTIEKTDAAEATLLPTYTSPALEKALLSSKTFWDFITDPSTPYLDRMAAANRGGAILSPEELPLLWQAMAEVSSVLSGVSPSPCSAIAYIPPPLTIDALRDALTPGSHKERERTPRMVLGHEIQFPTKTTDYPVTTEDRDRSPWLWQMEKALSILFDKTNIYYGDTRYPARVKAAWDWPIPVSTYRPGEIDRNFELLEWKKIDIRSRALTESAPHDILLFQTILKLALNNDNYYVAYWAHVDDLSSWGPDHHLEEMAQAAQIITLQKTRWENVAAQTAFVGASLVRRRSDPADVPQVKLLKSATAILAIGRWAMDKSLNPWNRYYSFVDPICRIVDDAPFPPDQLREPNDPRLDERLKTFEAWFEEKKPALERQAATERPQLQSLEKELSTDIE
jgi:hypothetical protein